MLCGSSKPRLTDPCFPPTLEEKEILNNILSKVCTGTVEFGGVNNMTEVRSPGEYSVFIRACEGLGLLAITVLFLAVSYSMNPGTFSTGRSTIPRPVIAHNEGHGNNPISCFF